MNNGENHKKYIKVYYVIILFFGLAYIAYCNLTFVELPYLTWFDQMPLAESYYLGKLQIRDLFSKYCEHGMLANNIIYLINIMFCHGTTFFDVYLNDLNVIISGCVLTYGTIKTLGCKKIAIFWITAEAVFMFSFIQGSSGAMETQVRLGLLFFLLTMWMVDRELEEENCSQLHFIWTLCMIILSINVFGTLYSFAGVPCVWAIVLFIFLKDKRAGKRNIVMSVVYVVTIPAYLIEYGGLGGADNLNASNFLSIFFHPVQMMKGLLAWYANGVLGWGYHESSFYQENVFLGVGAIVFMITLMGVVLFFYNKMYRKTWFPLMCIVYSFGVFVLVYLGRPLGWDWFSNEWYTVHIKISIAATIWIYAFSYNEMKTLKIGALMVCILVMVFGIVGNFYTIKRAPSVRDYYTEKQKYLFIENANDMPVDETGQTPLLHSLDATMNSIDIMKKYNLSVYQYWDAYEACPTTRLQDNVIRWISGRYDDGWCETEMKFSLHANDISNLEVSYKALKQQRLTIIINDIVENTIELHEGEGTFLIPCKDNAEMVIVFKSDYAAKLAEPDTRVASYCLSDIKCME